jgi:hypothetical protein
MLDEFEPTRGLIGTEQLYIFDNFLSEDLVKLINMRLNRGDLAFYPHRSSSDDLPSFFNTADISNEDALMFPVIKSMDLNYAENVRLSRCYVNANPSGDNQNNYHKDDGNFTFLYYPQKWDPSWGGTTIMKFSDGREEHVEYKQNRLIIFDPNISHKAAPHTAKQLRYTLVYKTHSEAGANLK